MADKDALTLTGNVQTVLLANPGVTFTRQQLQAIAVSDIVIKQGCIVRMVYRKSSEDLSYIELDPDGGVSAVNFNDFREVLKCAMDNGHHVLFCFNVKTNEMSMPHFRPCRCTCDKRD